MHNTNGNVVRGHLSENYLTQQFIVWNILLISTNCLGRHQLENPLHKLVPDVAYPGVVVSSSSGISSTCLSGNVNSSLWIRWVTEEDEEDMVLDFFFFALALAPPISCNLHNKHQNDIIIEVSLGGGALETVHPPPTSKMPSVPLKLGNRGKVSARYITAIPHQENMNVSLHCT